MNPRRYGQGAKPETETSDDERDDFELCLLRVAEERSIPVLGICRGLQLLNVFYGGTLIQHLGLPGHDIESEPKSAAAHEIEIDRTSRLGLIAGTARWQVNSRHHQAVDALGANLSVSARSPTDGVIEGLELAGDRFVVAVQWHPEDQIREYPEQLKLFRGFAEAIGCSKY